jgi:hypothetical protein
MEFLGQRFHVAAVPPLATAVMGDRESARYAKRLSYALVELGYLEKSELLLQQVLARDPGDPEAQGILDKIQELRELEERIGR